MVCTSHVTIWYASTCSMFCIWIWVNMNALYVRFSYSFRDVRRYDKLVKNLFCVVFESCQHSCNRFSSELNKLKTNAKRTKVKWKTILNTFIVGAVFLHAFACFERTLGKLHVLTLFEQNWVYAATRFLRSFNFRRALFYTIGSAIVFGSTFAASIYSLCSCFNPSNVLVSFGSRCRCCQYTVCCCYCCCSTFTVVSGGFASVVVVVI